VSKPLKQTVGKAINTTNTTDVSTVEKMSTGVLELIILLVMSTSCLPLEGSCVDYNNNIQ